MRFHWQNLNEKAGDRLGNPIRHGRAWWYGENANARIEWSIPTTHAHMDITFCDDEDDIDLSFACWLFGVWISFSSPRLHKWASARFLKNGYEGTEYKVSLHSAALWWSIGHPTMSWTKGTPKWRHGSFHPIDFIFGKTEYSDVPISEHHIEIPMPERVYPAKINLVEAQWRRKRWPFVWRRLRRATIVPDTPIPFPGKGESSYDCGEDATHSLTCCASTPEEAIGHMVASVMRSRLRYGGTKWRPEKVSAA